MEWKLRPLEEGGEELARQRRCRAQPLWVPVVEGPRRVLGFDDVNSRDLARSLLWTSCTSAAAAAAAAANEPLCSDMSMRAPVPMPVSVRGHVCVKLELKLRLKLESSSSKR